MATASCTQERRLELTRESCAPIRRRQPKRAKQVGADLARFERELSASSATPRGLEFYLFEGGGSIRMWRRLGVE